jgi:hypothetical protein
VQQTCEANQKTLTKTTNWSALCAILFWAPPLCQGADAQGKLRNIQALRVGRPTARKFKR